MDFFFPPDRECCISVQPWTYTDCETHRRFTGWRWSIAVERINGQDWFELVCMFDFGGDSRLMDLTPYLREITGYTRNEFIAELMQVVPKVRQ